MQLQTPTINFIGGESYKRQLSSAFYSEIVDKESNEACNFKSPFMSRNNENRTSGNVFMSVPTHLMSHSILSHVEEN